MKERQRSHWVILTTGSRPQQLRAALRSIHASSPDARVVVVNNGGPSEMELPSDRVEIIHLPRNVGVPAGRDIGLRARSSEVVFFLDDDATILTPAIELKALRLFDADERLAVVAMRLVDEGGETARRHVPRIGQRGRTEGGPAATFLGGACAIRTRAYVDAEGYDAELAYAHEELDLSWRLVDRGWRIDYIPTLLAYHPRTEIARHPNGWRLTGRNRVIVARRNLPLLVMLTHVTAWLLLGLVRAPDLECRRAYAHGWWRGWRLPVNRRPISWSAVAALARAGRVPVL